MMGLDWHDGIGRGSHPSVRRCGPAGSYQPLATGSLGGLKSKNDVFAPFGSGGAVEASFGTRVREAIQETRASKASPARPSRDTGSVTSITLTVAPSIAVSLRTKQTTSCPRCTRAAVTTRPIVPVAPTTQVRWRLPEV